MSTKIQEGFKVVSATISKKGVSREIAYHYIALTKVPTYIFFKYDTLIFKDTHREKPPSSKTSALTKIWTL